MAGTRRLGARSARPGLCGGKVGRLPLPWGPYRRSMKSASRGAVDVGGHVCSRVAEGGTQLVKPMLLARSVLSVSVWPVGQVRACGAGEGETEAGVGGEEVGAVGGILLSTSLCGWYRSGM